MKAQTITVPSFVPKRGIQQYVMAEAERIEKKFKYGVEESDQTHFEQYAENWLKRQEPFFKATTYAGYPDEVIDRLARAFYPAILACWNREEGQREFSAWQAEQAHHTPSKEKQSVPDGERSVVHIAIVCGLWQGASYSGAHPVFVLRKNLRNKS